MEFQNNNQIENIAHNVQTILEQELVSTKRFRDLETKISHLQNALLHPSGSYCADSEESEAFGEFLRKGNTSKLLTKALSSGADDGGVSIVGDLGKRILHTVNTKSVMRQLASVETISSSALEIIVEDGAFASGWIGESEARNVTDTPHLRKKTIPAHELYAQPKATQKLMDDAAIDINSWLVERLSDSFIKAENEAFINGDGDRKPTGLLRNNDVECIDVGSDVSSGILLNLINSLPEAYLSNASFLMNRTTLSAIQGLRDDNLRFIWQQSLSEPLKSTIFGIPVYCTSHMPNIGANNLAIAVGDFKAAYKIVDRSNITIMRDPYTDKPFIKFYAVKRVGGDVLLPQALKFARFQAPAAEDE